MDAKQAQTLVEHLTGLWEGEFPATCKVLAAVPDGRRTYRPDDKSRTAWELAAHIATSDIWFLQGMLDASFEWDPEAAAKAESQFATVEEVVEYYRTEFPKKLNEVRAMPAEKLTTPVDFFGMFKLPSVSYLGLGNNHSVHHRGQLAAYLRAMGSKVPAIYGMSADEPMAASPADEIARAAGSGS
jgi:uncharacterized damage-inducible protein DinB